MKIILEIQNIFKTFKHYLENYYYAGELIIIDSPMDKFKIFLLNSTNEEIVNFQESYSKFMKCVQPVIDENREKVLQYPQVLHNYEWDNERFYYSCKVLNLSQTSTQLQIVQNLLIEFMQNNFEIVRNIFHQYNWIEEFHRNHPIIYFSSQIFLNYIHTEDLESNLRIEWKKLLKLRNLLYTRLYPSLIQNLVLTENISYQIFSITKEFLDINDNSFSLEYSAYLRRITSDEYYNIFGNKIAISDFYRVSTLLEIEVIVPKSTPIYKIRSIDQFNQKFYFLLACALNLTNVGDYRQITKDAKWKEKYVDFFSQKSYSIGPIPFKTQFSLGKNVWNTSDIYRLKNIIEILYHLNEIPKIPQIFTQLARIPYHIDLDPCQGITSIWTFFESFFKSRGYEMIGMLCWMYGADDFSERLDEFNFWKFINTIRNKYVHGAHITEIEKYVKDKISSSQRLNSLIRVCQEKTSRILLRVFLYIYQEICQKPDSQVPSINRWNTDFCRQFLLGNSVQLSLENSKIWNTIIKKGTPSEFGLISNFRSTGTFKPINL